MQIIHTLLTYKEKSSEYWGEIGWENSLQDLPLKVNLYGNMIVLLLYKTLAIKIEIATRCQEGDIGSTTSLLPPSGCLEFCSSDVAVLGEINFPILIENGIQWVNFGQLFFLNINCSQDWFCRNINGTPAYTSLKSNRIGIHLKKPKVKRHTYAIGQIIVLLATWCLPYTWAIFLQLVRF